MRFLLRALPVWIASALLGSLAGQGLVASTLALIEPLGYAGVRFAIRDDQVPPAVRNVLANRPGRIHLVRIAGGTVGAVVSADRSAVAIAVSQVDLDRLPEATEAIHLLWVCEDEMCNLGSIPDRFLGGPGTQGWENSMALSVPEHCKELIIALVDGDGKVDSAVFVKIRPVETPAGSLA